MIRVACIDVSGFRVAIRGMRNPLESWHKSDSQIVDGKFVIGPNDLNLMRQLYVGGPEHRKYLRMIHVGMDIFAPEYWFKQLDTYRIGVTENSTSTMHKLVHKQMTYADFSMEDMDPEEAAEIVAHNEARRLKYLKTKDRKDWRSLIQGLPMSYNYLRTVDMNYENVINIIHQRRGHKLKEWYDFIQVLLDLPYVKEIMDAEER